jgi:hypothetical protein
VRKKFSEYRRFLALRACWYILRGKSVAWNLNITGDGGFESRSDDMLVVDCTDHGEPMSPENFSFDDPEPQPD